MTAAETIEEKHRSPLFLVWLRFKANRAATVSGIVLLTLILMAVFAFLITIASYDEQSFLDHGLEAPSSQFWFGIDNLGRDFFSRIVYGARVSLTIGFASAFFSALIGIPLAHWQAIMAAGWIGL